MIILIVDLCCIYNSTIIQVAGGWICVENIAYRMSACWHMRISVPSRSLQGGGNLYHK